MSNKTTLATASAPYEVKIKLSIDSQCYYVVDAGKYGFLRTKDLEEAKEYYIAAIQLQLCSVI